MMPLRPASYLATYLVTYLASYLFFRRDGDVVFAKYIHP